jgi:hypothetical protein
VVFPRDAFPNATRRRIESAKTMAIRSIATKLVCF